MTAFAILLTRSSEALTPVACETIGSQAFQR
jgi:hypothetical protein